MALGCGDRRQAVARVAPFAAAALLAFPLAALPPASEDGELLLAAGLLTVAALSATASVARERLPRWAPMVPSVAYFVVVGLLRHAEGGSISGYSPLLMLPAIWVALYGSRRELGMTLAALAATLITPMLAFGAPQYPSSEWRRTLVLAL